MEDYTCVPPPQPPAREEVEEVEENLNVGMDWDALYDRFLKAQQCVKQYKEFYDTEYVNHQKNQQHVAELQHKDREIAQLQENMRVQRTNEFLLAKQKEYLKQQLEELQTDHQELQDRKDSACSTDSKSSTNICR